MNGFPCPFLYLRGVESEGLGDIRNFLYKGETSVRKDNLDVFINHARDLGKKGFSEEDDKIEEIFSETIGENYLDNVDTKKKDMNEVKRETKTYLEINGFTAEYERSPGYITRENIFSKDRTNREDMGDIKKEFSLNRPAGPIQS